MFWAEIWKISIFYLKTFSFVFFWWWTFRNGYGHSLSRYTFLPWRWPKLWTFWNDVTKWAIIQTNTLSLRHCVCACMCMCVSQLRNNKCNRHFQIYTFFQRKYALTFYVTSHISRHILCDDSHEISTYVLWKIAKNRTCYKFYWAS